MLFCAAAAAEQGVGVARVINGKSLVLTSGETVRLAAIEAPNVEEKADGVHTARPGEPLGEEAKAALEKDTANHMLHFEPSAAAHDHHGRLLGQLYDENGHWLQQELLSQGWAMVYSFPDAPHALVVSMLAAEKEARAAGRGIWANPYFRIITPDEAAQFVNRFKLVEGKLVSVHEYHGHLYLNFSEQWKGHFAVFISRKYAEKFGGLNLPSLVGKTIRARGWIHYHNAPMIDLTHPEQIEVVD